MSNKHQHIKVQEINGREDGEISERGRVHYEKIPTMKHSIMYDFPTKRHFSIFAQLRTGQTEIN